MFIKLTNFFVLSDDKILRQFFVRKSFKHIGTSSELIFFISNFKTYIQLVSGVSISLDFKEFELPVELLATGGIHNLSYWKIAGLWPVIFSGTPGNWDIRNSRYWKIVREE